MAGTSYKVEFDVSELEKFIGSLSNFNPAELLDNIGELVESQTQDRFVSETDPNGKKWVKWSKKYQTSGKGIKILRNTQRLFGSINYQVKGNKVEIGSNVEYAATHQYGDNQLISRKTKDGGRSKPFSRNIPQRQFLGLGAKDKEEVNNLVKLYIEDLSNAK